ncbi:dioxygenase [Cystobacter fuscus]|uniref:Dioxygenase n=1 Tax=Cystobacter fuscus TaxID=43 RepID=A0A250J3M2_9BACT|nr:TauD/TfdA family dioxygenase [Cystobacter fuscus]ATB37756.1 dioxygenase [Cystobacter fuscus]
MKIQEGFINGVGALVDKVDVRRFGNEEARELRENVLYRRRFILFRGQKLSTTEYIDFARKLGTPQVYLQDNYHHPEHPEIFISSNVSINSRKMGVSRTGYYWHTDCSFQQQPLSLTMLYPRILPEGRRETLFIDMPSVLERLPMGLRQRLEGRDAWHGGNGRYKVREEDIGKPLHELIEAEARLAPPVRHPSIIQHPLTQERSLYVNEGFTQRIDGYAADESSALLADVFAFIARPEHVITHEWEEGDILVWDNRTLLHRSGASPRHEAQMIYRIGLYDGHPFYSPKD